MDKSDLERNRIFVAQMSLSCCDSGKIFIQICKVISGDRISSYKKCSVAVHITTLLFFSKLTPTFFALFWAFGACASMSFMENAPTLGLAWMALFCLTNLIFGAIAGVICAIAAQLFRPPLLILFLIVAFAMSLGVELSYQVYSWHTDVYEGLLFRWLFLTLPINVVTLVSYWAVYGESLAFMLSLMGTCKPDGLITCLPQHLRGDVLLVRALGHYVEVVTEKGRYEIRMRFCDAMKQLNRQNGMKVHRSYWVRSDLMLSLEKKGNRYFARTLLGEVPVSSAMVDRVILLVNA